MKGIGAKKISQYVTLLGVVLLVCVYFFVYKEYQNKSDALESSNNSLSQKVSELKIYYDNLSTYEEEMELMRTKINERLEEFPVDVKEEDMIALAIKSHEKAEIYYNSINMAEREVLKFIPIEIVAGAGMEELQQEIAFVERTSTYVNSVDYTNLKECIKMINNMPERMVIENITYGRNKDTNLLDGSISVTFYSVSGTNREYIPQRLENYESGLANLFRLDR